MAASPLNASAFALTAGRAADPRALFAVEPLSPARTAIVAVEPLDPSPHGVELAMLGRETLLGSLRRTVAADPAVALGQAFAAANAHLLVENRPSAGARWERRAYVGATALLVDGAGVTLGQVPPGQALVVQDGTCFAFPDLRTWQSDYVPDQMLDEPDPLGFGETIRPSLFRTVTAPGDLIVLCSAELGRLLARQSRREVAAREAALAAGDPERVLDLLERLVVAGDLSDATAAVVAVGGERVAAGGRGIRRPSLPGRRERPVDPVASGPAEEPAPRPAEPARERVVARSSQPSSDSAVDARPRSSRTGRSQRSSAEEVDRSVAVPAARSVVAAGEPSRTSTAPTNTASGKRPARAVAAPFTTRQARPRRVSFHVVLPESLRLALLTAAETLLPHRRLAPVPAAARPQSLSAPGAGSIQRHREPGGLPAEWYANLPRGFDVPISRPWLAVSLAVLLAVGGTRYVVERERGAATASEAAVVRLDDALTAAAAPGGDRDARLTAAEAAYDAALAAGVPAAQLADRSATLDHVRVAVWGVLPVADARPLGALPAGTETGARLLASGGGAFLLGDALYGIDPARPALVRLLGAGDTLLGQPVGPLRLGGADQGGLVVGDGTVAFARSDAGIWSAAPLGTSEGIDPAIAPFGAFGGALYTLDPARGILKLPAEAGEAPLVWASVDQFPDLASARDLAVDGSVRVLLGDGRVLTFYQHTLRATVLPVVTPPLEQPAFLARADGSSAVYIVDPATRIGDSQGRIVRLAADGSARQIVLPGGGSATLLAHATSVAIDERSGTVYLLADGQLWRAEVPDLPSLAVDPPMPGLGL